MIDSEKVHDILVARDLIRTVLEDTDEDLWAYEYLTDALLGLEKWFEEAEEI